MRGLFGALRWLFRETVQVTVILAILVALLVWAPADLPVLAYAVLGGIAIVVAAVARDRWRR